MYRAILLALFVFLGMPSVHATLDMVYWYSSRNIRFLDATMRGDRNNYPFNSINKQLILDEFTAALHQQYPNGNVVVYINMGAYYPTAAIEVEWGDLGFNRSDGTKCYYTNYKNNIGLVIRYISNQPEWEEIKRIVAYSVKRVDSIKKYQMALRCTFDESNSYRASNAYLRAVSTKKICHTIDRALLEKVRLGIPVGKLGKEPPGIQQVVNLTYKLKILRSFDDYGQYNTGGNIEDYYKKIKREFNQVYKNLIDDGKFYFTTSDCNN